MELVSQGVGNSLEEAIFDKRTGEKRFGDLNLVRPLVYYEVATKEFTI